MPEKATKTTELYVTTRNEIGAFARFTLPLRENKINIKCYCAYEQGSDAIFQLITNNNSTAKDLLTKAGYTVTEKPVVYWTINNTPGEINKATSALAESRINVTYSYSTTTPGSKTQGTVFATSDNNKTCDVLNRL